MRFIPYLRYFWYITWHWDPVIAAFTIYHEMRGEKKYHIHTMGEDELLSLKAEGVDISHASIYMPLNYYVLEKLMAEASRYPGNKTFLDIGCGKGRAMIVAASYGFKQVWGIDFSKPFCEEAGAITAFFAHKNPGTKFTIVHGDASVFDIPSEISTIFLFNPFDEVVMWLVVSRIVKSQEEHPRCIHVLYANPQFKSVFLDFGFTEIFRLKKWDMFEAVILELAL